MFYKADLLEIQQELLAKVSGARVVAALETALMIHGLAPVSTVARFDVSSGLYHYLIKKYNCQVFKLGASEVIEYRGAYLMEGTYSDITQVDGIYVYGLNGLRMRYAVQGQTIEEAQAQPPEVAVAVNGVNWGDLDTEEAAFEVECKAADWYYSYSDDLGVFKRGREKCDRLKAVAEAKGGKYAQIYRYYSER